MQHINKTACLAPHSFQLLTAGCSENVLLVHLYCLFMQVSIAHEYSRGHKNKKTKKNPAVP